MHRQILQRTATAPSISDAYNSWTEHASELGLVLFCRRSDGESYPIKKLEILNFPKSDFPDDFRKTLENHEKLAYCYIAGYPQIFYYQPRKPDLAS